jgi:hypothetical protein
MQEQVTGPRLPHQPRAPNSYRLLLEDGKAGLISVSLNGPASRRSALVKVARLTLGPGVDLHCGGVLTQIPHKSMP